MSASRNLGLLLLLVGSFLSACDEARLPRRFTVDVTRGDWDVAVFGEGHLEPEREVVATVPDKLQGTLEKVVDEGTFVEPGDFLFQVSTQNAERDARARRLNAGREQIQFEALRVENEQGRADRLEELGTKSVQLETAREKQAILLRGKDPLEIRKLRLQIEDARGQREHLEKRLATKRTLAGKGYASRLELLKAEDALEQASLREEKLRNSLAEAQEGPRTEERKQKKLQTRRYEVDLGQARRADRRQKRIDALSEERKRLSVASSDAAAAEREAVIGRARQTAISTGTVLYTSQQWSGSGRLTVGSQVWQGMRLLKVADVRRLRAVLTIPERDIERIKSGQTVRLRFPAMPGKTVDGTVSSVGRVPVSSPWLQQTGAKVYEVRVLLDRQITGLRPNLSVRASICCRHLEGVWRLPRQALVRKEQRGVVRVRRDGTLGLLNVVVEAQDADWVYVSGPLREREQVVLLGRGPDA